MRRLAQVVVGLAALVAAAAPAAGQAPETGSIVEVRAVLDGLHLTVEATVLHADGTVAPDAALSAAAVSDDGRSVAAARSAPAAAPGRRVASVTLPGPGRWTVQLRSSVPQAAADYVAVVGERPPVTEATTTAAPTTVVVELPAPTAGTRPSSDPFASSRSWLLLSCGIAAALIAASVALRVLRRTEREPDVSTRS